MGRALEYSQGNSIPVARGHIRKSYFVCLFFGGGETSGARSRGKWDSLPLRVPLIEGVDLSRRLDMNNTHPSHFTLTHTLYTHPHFTEVTNMALIHFEGEKKKKNHLRNLERNLRTGAGGKNSFGGAC